MPAKAGIHAYRTQVVEPRLERAAEEGEGGMLDGLRFLPACRHNASYCHSRSEGMGCLDHWIPACAGMTEGAVVRNLPEIAKGLSGSQQTYSNPRRHASEGWNPGGAPGC